MPPAITNRVRVGGSGFTVFRWNGHLLAFARQVAHTSPAPVGPGAVPIQPMDSPYPIQVITPAAAGMGSLVLDLYELYGAQTWERLGVAAGRSLGATNSAPDQAGIFGGAVDIVHIFRRQAAAKDPIQVVKYIQAPTLRGGQLPAYTEEYHNCVITNVVDGETIEVGTMEVLKQITIGYTHLTRGGRRGDDLKEDPQSGWNDSETTQLPGTGSSS